MTDRLRTLSQADQEKILNTKQSTLVAYFGEFFNMETSYLLSILPSKDYKEYVNSLITKTDHGLFLDDIGKKEIDTINYLFLHIVRNGCQPKS